MAARKVILYTCIVNNRDRPKIIEYKDDIEYVLFSDSLDIKAPGWEVRPLEKHLTDPVRTARYHKHNPFELFPTADYTIWLDATHWPYTSVLPLLSHDLAAMKHYLNSDVKTEIDACIAANLDEPQLMQNQLKSYLDNGFSDDVLYSTSCLIRKNTKNIVEFSRFWWAEITKWSKRDQISFPYCLWKTNTTCGIIPGACRNGYNPHFKMISHYRKFKKMM